MGAFVGQSRQSAEELFADALELDPAQRQTFIDRACGGDPARKRLLEELLREDDRAGSFLRQPIIASQPDAVATVSDLDRSHPAETSAQFRTGEIIAQRFLVVRF